MDVIELINRLQNELNMPDCFVLSEEKLMSDDTIGNLVQYIACDMLNIGDKYVLYEIIKQWLRMKRQEES
jgi:hypothetical protein